MKNKKLIATTLLYALVAYLLTACNSGSNSNQPQPLVQNTITPLKEETTESTLNANITAASLIFKHDAADNLALTEPSGNKNTSIKSPIALHSSWTIQELEKGYEAIFCQLNKNDNLLKKQVCQQNNKFISNQKATGYFNLNEQPLLNNKAGVTNVEFQAIDYVTTVQLPSGGSKKFNVSGGLLLPKGDNVKIKGVVVYFHGTTFKKSSVGSNIENPETILTAEVFASQGYIVLIPDYIGQGRDWRNVHPYVLFPKISVTTALDMLEAVKPKIQQKYGLNNSSKLKLFTSGYSEGGAYSLWFNTIVSNDPSVLDSFYELTHSVGMEGAYNTSKITKDFLFSDVRVGNNGNNYYQSQNQTITNLAKPILSADAFLSYAAYMQDSNYNSVFNDRFFAMNCGKLCNVKGKHLNLEQAFAQESTGIAMQVLFSALGKSNNGAIYGVNPITSTSNNVKSLVSQDFMSKKSQNELDKVLRDADVNLSNVKPGSVSIITLDQDSMVTPNNYDALKAEYGYSKLGANTKFKETIKIDHTKLKIVTTQVLANGRYGSAVIANVDHIHGIIYEFIYALNIFNSYSDEITKIQ